MFLELGGHISIWVSGRFREWIFAQVAFPISVTSARQNNSRRVPLLPPTSVSSLCLSHALCCAWTAKETYKQTLPDTNAKIWLWMTDWLRVWRCDVHLVLAVCLCIGRNMPTNQSDTLVTQPPKKADEQPPYRSLYIHFSKILLKCPEKTLLYYGRISRVLQDCRQRCRT